MFLESPSIFRMVEEVFDEFEGPKTVEEVFDEFEVRKAALITALTCDVEEFYRQCDSEKGNLCLIGDINGNWQVTPPVEMIPHNFPEPTLGINFARDKMPKKDFVSLVAEYSDAWLIGLAFFNAFRFKYDKADRMQLFDLINDLPTILEIVTAEMESKEEKEKSSDVTDNSNKSE